MDPIDPTHAILGRGTTVDLYLCWGTERKPKAMENNSWKELVFSMVIEQIDRRKEL